MTLSGETSTATERRWIISTPPVIVERNLSAAWGRAFLSVFESNEIAPLVVVIEGLDNADPPEIPAIRRALDEELEAEGRGQSCLQVANTIFPISLWNPKKPRADLYDRYLKIIHRVRRHRGNRYGVYFQRLIAHGADSETEENVNQLEHIISTWNRGNHRRSALQASLVDPRVDHTHQRQRGFPCLQQVAFAPVGDGGLAVTGFYAKQHMFERAYGNYLGLCRLGHFMAQEMGLTLSQVVCVATPAALDRPKRDLAGLVRQVESALSDFEDRQELDPRIARRPEVLNQGRLIVFEGPDGVGKTTLSRALASRLNAMGITCDHLSFPGKEEGTVGRLVYDAHHDPASYGLKGITATGLQALHIAAHLDEIDRTILPALREGRWVILDRFWWSTWVYGWASSVDSATLDALIKVERLHWRDIEPDALFLVDRSGAELDNDTRTLLREGYERLFDKEKGRYPIYRARNDAAVEESLGRLLVSLRALIPQGEHEAPTVRKSPLSGPSDQLPLLPPRTTAPAAFTTLSPARPTVVYESYWRFAFERQEVFFRKLEGLPPPWTTDPILAKHKFTNAYRASDRVSQYLIRNVIYEGNQSPEGVFFRTILFKLFNKIETWELLQNQMEVVSHTDYSFADYDRVLTEALADGTRIYSAAYMMPSGRSSFGHAQKHRNHLLLLERMMEDGVPQRITEATTMAQAFDVLRSYPTIGDFLAYQFVTDLNYSSLTDFSEMEFVIPGPGALDGIRKCFADQGGLNDTDIIRLVTESQEREFERLGLKFRMLGGRHLQLIDCQNLFCEVSKYARVKHPEIVGVSKRSRIKQLYRPKANPIGYWYPPKWGINHLFAPQGGPG